MIGERPSIIIAFEGAPSSLAARLAGETRGGRIFSSRICSSKRDGFAAAEHPGGRNRLRAKLAALARVRAAPHESPASSSKQLLLLLLMQTRDAGAAHERCAIRRNSASDLRARAPNNPISSARRGSPLMTFGRTGNL